MGWAFICISSYLSYRTGDLAGAQAPCTDMHMARSTVDNRLDALYIGLPHTVGTSMGVGYLDTKAYALATIITFSHQLHLLAIENGRFPSTGIGLYCTRILAKLQLFFYLFSKVTLYLPNCDFQSIMSRENIRERGMAMTTYMVSLQHLTGEFKLEMLYQATDFEKIQIIVEDVNRPALQLTGFFEHFEPARLQVLGLVETTYLGGLTPEQRLVTFDRLLSFRPPAVIIARGIEPYPECMAMARKHNITVLRTQETTSELVSSMIATLKHYLAPRLTRHGVLVEVHGEGMLLMGESGVGKSEAAIELVKRGHRLIADDAVEIQKEGAYRLSGSAPELIRHYIELRGIGVINVAKLFGMGAIKDSADIDIVVNLEAWKDNAAYDRLGIENEFTTILGVKIPMLTIPVKPGRNLAVILEVAAMNNRQKKMGYNAALEFTEQINKHFDASLAALDS